MNSTQLDPVMLLPPDQRVQAWADQAWPLRFKRNRFDAACWNTRRCSIVYDNYEFGPRSRNSDGEIEERPCGAPPSSDWKDHRTRSYSISDGRYCFPAEPAKLEWTSLDGSEHKTTVDLEAIFKDRLVLHNVKREGIPEGWLAAKTDNPVVADILLEVNDRTVNVHFKAHVTTIQEQEPGNPRSHHRVDWILAWTRT